MLLYKVDYMVSVEDSVIARLTKDGERFEILVDPEKSLEVKKGEDIPLEDLLGASEIYEDSKKGARAAEDKVNKAFGTNDLKTIVYKIIRDGEVQITTEQRKEMLEEKKKKIVNIISKRGINPQTGVPHPPDRILRAMDQAKVRIDLERRVEEQIESILKDLQKILPIKFERVEIAIKVPAQFAGKVANVIRSLGQLKKEEWKNDGSYIALIEIPAGLQQDVYDRLNSLTRGQIETKIIKKGD